MPLLAPWADAAGAMQPPHFSMLLYLTTGPVLLVQEVQLVGAQSSVFFCGLAGALCWLRIQKYLWYESRGLGGSRACRERPCLLGAR